MMKLAQNLQQKTNMVKIQSKKTQNKKGRGIIIGSGDESGSEDVYNESCSEDSSQQSSEQTSSNKIPRSNSTTNRGGVAVGSTLPCECESILDSHSLKNCGSSDFSFSIEKESISDKTPKKTRPIKKQNKKKLVQQTEKKKRKNHSNTVFKKACNPLRRIVKDELKVKVNPYESFYKVKYYFLLSLLLLQKKHCLFSDKFKSCFQQYVNKIEILLNKEKGDTPISNEYIEYFKIGKQTFWLYAQGKILQAFKHFYQYDTMKQKGNFKEAINIYQDKRKQHQMRDIGLMKSYKSENLVSQLSIIRQKQALFVPNQFDSQHNLINYYENERDESIQFNQSLQLYESESELEYPISIDGQQFDFEDNIFDSRQSDQEQN